jgi:hypothetical protein
MGVRAYREPPIVTPLQAINLSSVPAKFVHLAWRTYIKQREPPISPADGEHARTRPPCKRADAHPVSVWPRSHTAARGCIPYLHGSRCGSERSVEPPRRKQKRADATKAWARQVAEVCDLSRVQVLIVHVMSTGDGDDVGRGPGERIGPGILGYPRTIKGKNELSPFSEVSDCGGLMNDRRRIEELGGAPAQRCKDLAVGRSIRRIGELKEPVICETEYFCHSVGAWRSVHGKEGLGTCGNEPICLEKGNIFPKQVNGAIVDD